MLADVFAIILTVVVVTIRLMLLPIILFLLVGRCYCHVYWQMLLPILCELCLNHIDLNYIQLVCRLMLLPVADVIATAG